MEFGKLLKTLRKKKGVSIKQMAPALGVNYTYLSKLENSKVNPSPKVISKISHYFSYDNDELMLSAGKFPKDIEKILRENPREAINYLRGKFGGESR